MIDRLLVMVIGMVLMTAISVQLLLCCLPLFRRIEFDAVCHQYALLMDQSGGLTGTAAANLVQTLQDRHFTVTVVQAPEQAAYGDIMTMTVQATFTDMRLTMALQMEEVNACFVYEASMVCRILQAFDAVP
ncbi:MAG: hypothetical protein SCM11_00175 [Bacillota bacterium]|nr:hypothetical protein [Bacillota bacterium]